MPQTHAFTIFNASAGSGKTYTLVKEYLKVLLQSSQANKYKQLLAITFTNKAVFEMKSRVLDSLQSFANHDANNSMLLAIAEELNRTPKEIAKQASEVLTNIIHNYAAFDIVTIDTFTHRILRTFAKDLQLSSNFEVSLQAKEVLRQGVDALIDRAGTDQEITQTLVDFALEKADDDKSWDISLDLNTIAKRLLSENDLKPISELQSKTLKDFTHLKSILHKKVKQTHTEIQHLATAMLDLFEAEGLEKSDFTRGTYFSYWEKLLKEDKNLKFDLKWQNEIQEYSFYTKATTHTAKATIDRLKPDFIAAFEKSKALWHTHYKFESMLRLLTPLSVLHLIHQELEALKKEENIVLISDFNKQIFTYLQKQPAAFIYERLGERYTNYFIDEFQDTSILQWRNLIPLIDNALESQATDTVANSLLLVGDPKQAIYRWRGGAAEQFIDLTQKEHPFSLENIEVASLDTNWRSHKNVIAFNNSFFRHIAATLDNEVYRAIYHNDNKQHHNFREGGQVRLTLVPDGTVEEKTPLYLEKVLAQVTALEKEGIPLEQVCILTRKNKQGAMIAQHLSQHNYKVVSPDSLLIDASAVVQCIDAILRLIARPDQPEVTITVLEYLANTLEITQPYHFLKTWVHKPTQEIFEMLAQEYQLNFSIAQFEQYPLYEGVEYVIRSFNLSEQCDAFVMGYLDEIYSFSQKHSSGLGGFLQYYEDTKDTLSIAAASQKGALQVMSIHKSKGLEFAVVIYPFADTELSPNPKDAVWYPVSPDSYGGFDHLLVRNNKQLAAFGLEGQAIFERLQEQEHFDAINLLYVAMTRAVERLYIFSSFRESKTHTITTYGDLFVDYLKKDGLWETDTAEYTWGDAGTFNTAPKPFAQTTAIPFYSSAKESHHIEVITKAAFLWDDHRQKAINFGNLIHELMARINTRDQAEGVIAEALSEGLIAASFEEELSGLLEQVLAHPDLKELFQPEHQVYTERPILAQDGSIHIPDRIEVKADGTPVIIDYKTGEPQESHEFQLDRYTEILIEMGLPTPERKLVYVNDQITVLNI